MKIVGFVLMLLLVGAGVTWYSFFGPRQTTSVLSPVTRVVERPLDRYSIDNLSQRQGIASQLTLGEAIATESAFTAYIFHFKTEQKSVTGLAHLPTQAVNQQDSSQKFPVVVQLRGYVDQSIFAPGVGTKRSAEVFATHGYISLAPDFLGYGGSDNPSNDVFEERFQTYTTVLDLLASVSTLAIADSSRIGIWAHSNGGQIALTVLEVTRGKYPTTLWAPVTKPFPYSILYFTDEADDKGKALRKKLADLEQDYDVDAYAMTNFIERISAPIQLHQGTTDDAVPVKWNDEFVAAMKEKKLNVEYYMYPGSDHNMNPSWDAVILRDIEFFDRHLMERGT